MGEIINLLLIGFIVGFTAVKKYKSKNIFSCITGGLGMALMCVIIHLALIKFI